MAAFSFVHSTTHWLGSYILQRLHPWCCNRGAPNHSVCKTSPSITFFSSRLLHWPRYVFLDIKQRASIERVKKTLARAQHRHINCYLSPFPKLIHLAVHIQQRKGRGGCTNESQYRKRALPWINLTNPSDFQGLTHETHRYCSTFFWYFLLHWANNSGIPVLLSIHEPVSPCVQMMMA